jgi:hypothetical protein
MCARPGRPSIETDGWSLLSAEERHAAHPDTFLIPPRAAREALAPGTAAKLLFDIETKEAGRVIDRGVDRMWVIITGLVEGRYTGVLDSDPGSAGSVNLRQGDAISFGPEHIAQIDYPPAEYITRKYGSALFSTPAGRTWALSIQVQPARADGLDVPRLSSAFADLAGSDLVQHHSFSEGVDKTRYLNFTFGTTQAAALWRLMRSRFYDDGEFGPHMRKASMAMCSSERGWDDYALLYHFNPEVTVDGLPPEA